MYNAELIKKEIEKYLANKEQGTEKFVIKYGHTANLTAVTVELYAKFLDKDDEECMDVFPTKESWTSLGFMLGEIGFTGNPHSGYEKIVK